MTMKAVKSKLVIFLCLPLGFLFVVDSFPLEKEFEGICTRVLDGDTIIVKGRRIRLAYIDAPESKQRSFDGVLIGKMSTKYLKRLILGKKVVVKFYEKGRYGRIIGVVYKGGEINIKMVRSGMALAYGEKSDVKYRAVEFEAKLLRRGVFKTSGFLRPGYYRKK